MKRAVRHNPGCVVRPRVGPPAMDQDLQVSMQLVFDRFAFHRLAHLAAIVALHFETAERASHHRD
jgi:hypothetical protein